MEEEIKKLKDALNFYGIEILEDGSAQFKPATMDKWRRLQNAKYYRTDLEVPADIRFDYDGFVRAVKELVSESKIALRIVRESDSPIETNLAAKITDVEKFLKSYE